MSSERIDLYKELSEKEKNLEQFNRTDRRFKVDLEYIQESSAANPSNNLIIESSNNNINLVVGPEKTITLHGKVSIPGLININELSIDGDASFNKSVYIGEHLDIDGDASFNSSVDIVKKLNVSSVFVSSDVSVNGNVNIGKSLTVDTLLVNSDVSINGDVSLNSNVSILNNLDVDGKVSLNNEVDISDNLYVNGDVSFQRNLDVSGSITARTIKVLSDISINGELDMSGIIFANSGIIHATQEVNAGVKSYIHKNDGTTSILSNFEALGDASFSAGVNISGGLMVGGHPSNDEIIFGNDVSFQRSVQIGYDPSYTGPSYTSNFKVYMDSSFGESVDISENLNVNNKLIVRDDVSLNNNVDIKGKLHIKNRLETDGDASLNGDVDIAGRLNILGDITMKYLSVEQIDVTNTLTVDGDVSFNANVEMANKLNVAGDVSLNSDVFMANKLNVDGNVSLGADVDVDENLTVARDLSVNLDIKVGNKMTVGGDVSLNASVDILTDLNVRNKLVVSNDVSLNKNVDITNNLNVGGNIVTIGNLQANDVTFADFSATNIIVNENVIEIGKDIDNTIPVKIGIGSYAGNVNQGDDGIAIGRQSGLTGQGANSVSVGFKAGNTNQGANAIVIGSEAGFTSQKEKAISIGDKAGYNSQETNSIAIGSSSGYTTQAKDAVAVGNMAGNSTQQEGSVGLGYMAGKSNQGLKTVAVGYTAGESNQGNYAIAIGSSAGKTSQATKSIILNATGTTLNGGNSGLYIDPIRTGVKPNIMQYDIATKELVHSTQIDIPGTITSSDISCDTLTTNGLINTQNNDINMGSGNIVCNTVTSEGLVIAGDVDISDNLTVSGSIISRGSISSGYNTNTTSFLGRAAIGYTGLNDIASFSHIDSNTAGRYGFSQKSNGRTSINAPTGEYITLGINNIPKVKLATDGKLGIGTTDPTSLLHVEGDVSLNLNADVAQNLNVYGDTYLAGKLDVESDVSFASSVTIRSGDITNVSIEANSYGGSGVVNDLALVSSGSTKIATAGTIKDFQIGALDMSSAHFTLIDTNTTHLSRVDISIADLVDTSGAHFQLINKNTADILAINTGTGAVATDASIVNLRDTSDAHFLLIDANTTHLSRVDISIGHLVDTSNAHYDHLTRLDISVGHLVDISVGHWSHILQSQGDIIDNSGKIYKSDLSLAHLVDTSNAHYNLILANGTGSAAHLTRVDISIGHLVDTSNAHHDHLTRVDISIGHLVDISVGHWSHILQSQGDIIDNSGRIYNSDLSVAHLVDTSNAHYDLIIANGTGSAAHLERVDISIGHLVDASAGHWTHILAAQGDINNVESDLLILGGLQTLIRTEQSGWIMDNSGKIYNADLSLAHLVDTSNAHYDLIIANGTGSAAHLTRVDISIGHLVDTSNAHHDHLTRVDISIGQLEDISAGHWVHILAAQGDINNVESGILTLTGYQTLIRNEQYAWIMDNSGKIYNSDLSVAHLVDTSDAHFTLINSNTSLLSATPGTASGSKAVVLDSNKDIGAIRNLTASGSITGRIVGDISLVDYVVTVASKTSNHPYNGSGSGSGYFLNGLLEAPTLLFEVGKTYRFKQDNNTNGSHQIRFYNDAGKTSAYSTNVSLVGTAGNAGSYSEIFITPQTANVLYYQCVNHGYMGGKIIVSNTTINANTSLLSATPGTAVASKAIITDSNTSIAGLTDIGITGQLTGPATFIIDPAAVGDNTGIVIIKGSLQVDGTTTTINSSILDISDHRIYLASNATNQTQTFGAGIEVYGNKTFTYQNGDIWESNIDISAAGITTTAFDVSTINTTGRVGINMNAPLEALDIYGTIKWGESSEQMTLPFDRGSNGQFLQTDGNGTLTFVTVDTSITISDSTANTNFPIVFNNESGGLLDDTGSFTYNPSTGIMTVDTTANVYGEGGPATSAVFGHSSFTSREESGFYQQSTGDTFVNAKSGQVINFNSGFNTRMTMTSGGSFGIGVTAPDTKLHVDGNVLIGSTYNNANKSWSSTTNIQMTLGGAHNAEYNRGSKVKLLITGYDNGDANEDNPVYPIYCEDENGNDDFFIKARDGFVSANSIAYFGGDVAIGLKNPTEALEVIGDISCSGDLHVTGNIGLGTSSPQGLLHLSSGTSGDCVLILEADTDNSNENDNPRIEFRQDGGLTHSAIANGSNDLQILNSAAGVSAGGITLHTNNINGFANAIERMRITRTGNVAIGLTNPTKKLEVVGDISCSSEVHVTGKIGIKMNAPQEALDIYGTIKWGEEGEQMTLPYDRGGDGQFLKTDGAGVLSFATVDTSITITDSTANTNFPIVFNNESGGLLDDTGSFTYNPSTGTMTVDTTANVYGEGGPATSAVFGHSGFTSRENSGFYQQSTGDTFVNAKPGQVINFNSGFNTKMTMTSGGSFGIGLTNPTEALEVIGDISCSGDLHVTGSIMGKQSLEFSINDVLQMDITDTYVWLRDGFFRVGKSMLGTYTTGNFAMFTNIFQQGANSYCLLHQDDGTSLLNAATGKSINFRINNVTKMAIDSTGNIGIGLTNPTEALEVVGDISCSGDLHVTGGVVVSGFDTDIANKFGRASIGYVGHSDWAGFSHIDRATANNFALLQSTGGQTVVNASTGQPIKFHINNAEKMRVHSDGNVGIGTSSPGEKLEVIGNIKATGSLHKLVSTNDQNGVVMTKDNHNLLGIPGSKGAGLIIHGDATSSNAYGGSLAITGAQVNQGGHGPFIEFLGSRSTYAQLASGTHTAVADGDVLGYFRWMGDDGTDVRNFVADIACEVEGTVAENKIPGAIKFRTENGTSFGERMRLSATGYLGINTDKPTTHLNVLGTISTGRNLAREVGTVTDYSSQINTARGAANVINGKKNFENGVQDWLTGSNARDNAYVTIDLGAAYFVDRIVVYNQNEYPSSRREVKHFTLEGSTDGTTFTNILTNELGRSNAHEPNPGWSFRIAQNWDDDNEGVQYRYFKFIMTSFMTATDNVAGIMEIELYEATNAVDDIVSSSAIVAQDVYSQVGNFSRGLTVGPGFGGVSTGQSNLLVQGNVGIGRSDPQSALVVNGALDFTPNQSGVHIGYAGTDAQPSIELAGSSAGIIHFNKGNGQDFEGGIYYKHDSNYMHFTTARGERLRIDASGHVGIGTASPGEKLHVEGNIKATGDIQMKTLSTPVIGKITPIYARGTGQNNASNRLVHVGDSTLLNDSNRGLALIIINAGTHAHVSTTNYDTLNGTTQGDALATAIEGLGDQQIGIIVSNDAWEASHNIIGTNLKNAALKVGLTRLAALTQYQTDNRHPYAAIFYGGGTSSLPGNQAIEIIKSDDSGAAYATLSTFLVNDSFIGQVTASALYHPSGDATQPVVYINYNGNVGIGTTSPGEKLHVEGNIKGSGIVTAGNARIGDFPLGSNFAMFSHSSASGSDNYGLLHDSAGGTYLNAASTKQISFRIQNQAKMLLDTNGQLGIGLTNPTKKLEVIGDISASGDLHITGNVLAEGTIGNTVTGINGISSYNLWNVNSTLLTELKSYISTYGQRYNADGSDGWGSSVKFSINTSLTANGGIALWNETFKLNVDAEYGISLRTGIGNPVERLKVDNNGNVGIGLTNPTKKLEVIGDISGSGAISAGKSKNVSAYLGYAKIGYNGSWANQASFGHEDVAAGSAAINQSSGGATTIGTTAGGVGGTQGALINFVGNDSTIMMAHADNDGGRLGIGINSTYPTEKLEVGGNIKVSGGGSFGNAALGSLSTLAKFHHKDFPGGSDYALLQSSDGETYLNTKSGKNLSFRENNGVNMHIQSGGNVGIGTTSPTAKLVVFGPLDDQPQELGVHMGYTSGNGHRNNLMFVGNHTSRIHFNAAGSGGVASAGVIQYYHPNNSMSITVNGGVKLHILDSGNVGIGTTSPGHKLDVNGNIRASGIIEVGADTNTASIFGKARIGVFGQQNWAGFGHLNNSTFQTVALIQSDTGNTQLNAHAGKSIRLSIDGNSKMAIDSNGNVGIGITNPSEKLHVEDSILVNAWYATTASLTSSEWTTKSDRIIFLEATQEPSFGSYGSVHNHNADNISLAQAIAIGDSTIGQNPRELATLRYAVRGGTSGLFFRNGFNPSGSNPTLLYANSIMPYSHSGNNVTDGMSINASDGVSICTGNNNRKERFRVHQNGNVGIGTTNPAQKLDIAGLMKSLGVIYGNTTTVKQWKTSLDNNGNLYFRYNNGNGSFMERGYLNQGANVGNIDFTGQHRSKFEGDFTSDLVGLIVESTGAYLELDGSVQPKIDEALPSVKLTTAAKSKRVYGVLSNIEGDTREYGSGFVTVVPKDDNITRVVVNSVGEGSLWVINTREQALENGDYICSSNVAGYGEKQDDDILHSYTVAKITMSLDWSNPPDWLETRNVTASGEVSETGEYKAAFVGVTYHCG